MEDRIIHLQRMVDLLCCPLWCAQPYHCLSPAIPSVPASNAIVHFARDLHRLSVLPRDRAHVYVAIMLHAYDPVLLLIHLAACAQQKALH